MSIFHQLLLFILILVLISVGFRLALRLLVKLHLLPLGLYLLMTRFFFPDWAAAHELLYMGLLAAIIVGTLAVWLTPVIRRFREERRAKQVFLSELQFAREHGLSPEDYHFEFHNGVPLIEYDK